MFLAVDAGNTNIKIGVYEGVRLIKSWRMETDWNKTSDEYGLAAVEFFRFLGLEPKDVDGAILSSVVPSLNYTLERMIKTFFEVEPLVVGPGIKTGINILYDSPRAVGADRICNAVAAYEVYGGPCITIDFGTATTFGAVSTKGDFMGGTICPGIKVALEALHEHAARLPKVELIKPPGVLCKNTISGMQAGIIYGYIGQVDYIVGRMKTEMKQEGVKVIATGGMAKLIASESKVIDHVDKLLTLKGLQILYQRNVEGGVLS